MEQFLEIVEQVSKYSMNEKEGLENWQMRNCAEKWVTEFYSAERSNSSSEDVGKKVLSGSGEWAFWSYQPPTYVDHRVRQGFLHYFIGKMSQRSQDSVTVRLYILYVDRTGVSWKKCSQGKAERTLFTYSVRVSVAGGWGRGHFWRAKGQWKAELGELWRRCS